MQWIQNVYLIAAIAAIMAAKEDPRAKRDLSLLTKLLTGKEHQHHKTKIYHVQSVDNYIVKAVPKVPSTVETVETVTHKISQNQGIAEHQPVAVSGSTDTQNESYFAVQGEQNMVETGVFRPPKPVDKIVETASVASQFAFGAGVENHEHISTLHQHSAPLHTHVDFKPVLEICDEPVKVHLPNIEHPTKYSYKQIHNDGLTTYTSNDNKNVIVTDTRVPPPLPHYLNNRFKEILALNFLTHPVSAPHVHVTHPLLHVDRHLIHGSHQSAYEGHFPTYYHHHHPSIHVSHPSTLHVEHPLNYGTYAHHVSHQSAPGAHQMINGIHEAVHVPQHYDSHQSVDIYQPSVHVSHPQFYDHQSEYPLIYVHQTPAHVTPASVDIPSVHSHQSSIHVSHPRPHKHINHLTSVHGSLPLLHIAEPSLHIVETPEPSINNMSKNPTPVSSSYSYKHLHNDGKVTSYFGSGTVEEHQQAKPINSEVSFEAGHHNTFDTITYTPSSVFSFKNNPQDSRVTDNLQFGKEYNNDKTTLVVQNVETPQAPGLLAAQIENVSGTFSKQPLSKVVGARNYYESRNIYSRTESPLGYNNNQRQTQVTEILNLGIPNVHSDLDSKIPSTFSYNTLHSDGSITSHSDSRFVTQNPNGHFHGTYYCEDGSHVEDIKKHLNLVKNLKNSGKYSYKAVHNDGSVTTVSGSGEDDANLKQNTVRIPSIVNIPALPETKNMHRTFHSHTDTQQNIFDPINSLYSYRQVYHNLPGEFTTRSVSDAPEFQGHAEIQIASENGMQTAHSLGYNEELYSSTYGPSSTVKSERISGITGNSGESGIFEKDFTLSSTRATYDESLSSNPIVVLPDKPTFSYTQNRLDGSSVTILGNKENTVAVTEEIVAENRGRGDIPDGVV